LLRIGFYHSQLFLVNQDVNQDVHQERKLVTLNKVLTAATSFFQTQMKMLFSDDQNQNQISLYRSYVVEKIIAKSGTSPRDTFSLHTTGKWPEKNPFGGTVSRLSKTTHTDTHSKSSSVSSMIRKKKREEKRRRQTKGWRFESIKRPLS
jgi:D-tyrosyl-tRNA(Tyr) deacylase